MFTDGCDTGSEAGNLSRMRRHTGYALPATSCLNPKGGPPCRCDGVIGSARTR